MNQRVSSNLVRHRAKVSFIAGLLAYFILLGGVSASAQENSSPKTIERTQHSPGEDLDYITKMLLIYLEPQREKPKPESELTEMQKNEKALLDKIAPDIRLEDSFVYKEFRRRVLALSNSATEEQKLRIAEKVVRENICFGNEQPRRCHNKPLFMFSSRESAI